MEGAPKIRKFAITLKQLREMLKHERVMLDGLINHSRRFNLKALHRVLRNEQPELITALYDKYGNGNPLVEKLVHIADIEMDRADWLQERLGSCAKRINIVRTTLFDLYNTTRIEGIREALDQFTSQREMLCKLLKTDAPLSMADREYLLELLRDPLTDPAVKRMSKRKSTPNQ